MNPVEHRVEKQICLRVPLTEIRCALLSIGSQFAFRFRIYRRENGYEFPFLFRVCIALENEIRSSFSFVTGETDLQLPFLVFCQFPLSSIKNPFLLTREGLETNHLFWREYYKLR